MKMTKVLSLLLVFIMAIGIFAGCCKDEEEKKAEGKKSEEAIEETAPVEEIPEEVQPEPEVKEPTDEELIDEVLNATSEAICAFDMEKASEYILDESDLEKGLSAAPEAIDGGIEEIKEGVSKEIDNNSLLKYVGDDIKKTIKDVVSDGLQEGKQAIMDSIEFEWGEKKIDGDKATADVTVKVGGKKIIALMSDGSDDAALDMVMDYLDKVLEKKGKAELLLNTKAVAEAVVDEIVNDIKNGEKEEKALTASLEKIDGQWIITEMKAAETE